MLELNGIRKTYVTGTTSVEALKGIDLKFRDSEFVSILGQSGCGKTTLLNIIGGLDKYTSGDLKINGRSTKDFKDRDWDAYRNNSIGFVFQSYNLIPHQTVLSNVELALTLSGVSKAERRQRATEALEKVGLKEQIHKKPNQMSGGQMQRVAIARALVNDPDILLADEPTGALDTQTSIQIMDLLKEISKDRLIIMVTHNPELATQYSTRIIRLLDGTITDDSNPYNGEDDNIATKTDEDSLTDKKSGKTKKKKTSMSFFTALSLSLNNLMTKKTRTILTAFAGSIGIIGIALILSISNGIQNYIDRVQRDTLSSYPIQLQKESVDVSSMIENMMGNKDKNVDHDKDKIYSNNIMTDMVNSMVAEVNSNNLKAFKSYLENHKSDVDGYISDIQYSYDVPLYIYSTDTSDGVTQLNPSSVMENMYGMSVSGDGMMSAGMQNTSVWSRLFDNRQMLDEQYDLIAGSWADNYNEVMLVVDENNEIDDYTLYSLGFKDPAEVKKIFKNVMAGNSYETEETQYTYDEVLDKYDKMMDWLAGVYVRTLNVIHYMHDKYYYEAAEMALIDTDVRRTFATGIAGFSHVVDSLSAIKYAKVKTVRDENGVVVDFETEGDFPRYGNDDDRADEIAVWLLKTFMAKIKKCHTYRNSEPTTSILTITSNVVYGKATASLPDGRKAGEPLSPGANPSYGAEQNGLVASLNSVAKLPYEYALDGISNTQTINPDALGHEESEQVTNLVNVLNGYFDQGAHHLNVNVFGKEKLIDAMEHPEKEEYANFTIRVSGYAVKFIDLTREQQLDVISRTCHASM